VRVGDARNRIFCPKIYLYHLSVKEVTLQISILSNFVLCCFLIVPFNCCDSSWLFAVCAFCFTKNTILFYQNLIVNLVIIIHLHADAVFVCCVKNSLALPASPILFQLATNGMSKSMSCPNIFVPGEALTTVIGRANDC
jgi:hypothetical protein